MSEPDRPHLPPLLRGRAVTGDVMRAAARAGAAGEDPGLICHELRPDRLRAAMLLAPEPPLGEALTVVLALANGFADAFGVLSPSEIAFQLNWPAGFLVNGAACGGMRAMAPHADPAAGIDWLAVGIEVPIFAEADDEPGAAPDRTTLWDEGCADIDPMDLLEAWGRHGLVWINAWVDGERARIHRDWTGRAPGLGQDGTVQVAGATHRGHFVGMDAEGELILRQESGTRALPLTAMLETGP
ncbi:biotin/lipoate--protein ligase family protein [Palleronia sediminis]|nr:biotin/lipoate--protein ligase family protein [Palleronia sediminis]